MTTTQRLYYVSKQLNIYVGLLMFISGLIGGLWNIFVFRHYSFRSNSSCTYMFIGSIASLIRITFALTDQIIDQGFQIHWTAESIVWCKIRYYIAECASLTALSCLVLSVVDRFFSTCRQIKWRHLNSVYTARQISSFVILFWMLIAIPTLIYAKPIESSLGKCLCTSSSIIWSKITTYFFTLCCHGIFPWFFMSLFSCLTLRNTHRTRTRRIGTLPTIIPSRMTRIGDQLTSLLYIQTIICIIWSVPFCIEYCYRNFTQTIEKTAYRQAQEYFFEQISHWIFNLNYVATFYVNYIFSIIFRNVSKRVLKNLFTRREFHSQQITIINHQESHHHQFEKHRSVIFPMQPISRV